MDVIHINDLAVLYRVGVPDAERARPQRLLLDIQLRADFSEAAACDDLSKTIDYFALTQRLLKFGEGREWKLIEKLAEDISAMILREFQPVSVRVEIKKFIIAEARYVAVAVERPR